MVKEAVEGLAARGVPNDIVPVLDGRVLAIDFEDIKARETKRPFTQDKNGGLRVGFFIDSHALK